MYKSMREYGEWALVTGGSSGIGKSMVERFCRDGVNCIVVSNEEEVLNKVSKEFSEKYNVEVVPCFCDLSKNNFMEPIEQKVEGKKIDILVNCAAFGIKKPFLKGSLQSYLNCTRINVDSYLILTYRFLSGMLEKNKGCLIFVSTVNAFSPVGYCPVYTSAKAFVLYLGEAIWQEIKEKNTKVKVLTICPSATKTNFQSKAGTKVADWAWEPDKVVEVALKRIGKQSSVVISWRGKIYYCLTKFLPRKFSIKFATWAINSTLSKEKCSVN